MKLVLSQAAVYRRGQLERADVAIEGGRVAQIAASIAPGSGDTAVSLSNCVLIPGLVDVHVHLREPGFLYKETIRSGTMAAARGGYTAVCAMPNLDPVPDSAEHLEPQLDAIKRDARVRVYPYGAITVGQRGEVIADIFGLAGRVCGFSDDGRGVQDEQTMLEAMRRAAAAGALIAQHCEDERELQGGWQVHEDAAARLGLLPCPSRSEWAMVQRDVRLAAETGCRYHVCHVSTKESVALIREAKARGVDVTCETAPHYLLLTDADVRDDGRYKMAPPIRSAADREALTLGLLDGTIDMIATDHAPHSAQEKSRGLGSVNGVVGLECAFAALYTALVKPGILPLGRLVELMALNPRRRFGLAGGEIEPGQIADLAAFELDTEFTLDPAEFASMGRSTPFQGWRVCGRTALTMVGGDVVYRG